MSVNKEITPFNVINYDINSNEFIKYDVMPYFIRCYESINKKDELPKSFEEFKDFIISKSRYMYWARCQYEVILNDWPVGKTKKKIDIHWQLMNNIDLVTKVFMENVL